MHSGTRNFFVKGTFVKGMCIKGMGGLLLASIFISGCKSGQKSESPGPNDSANATYTQIDPKTAGGISGTIKFAKKAPPRIEIDMAQDPACSLSADPNYSEQYMVKDGKLENVFIYVKDGLGNKIYPAPTTPVKLDQKGCRYRPHVIGVQVGQPVEFTNSDPTMHNIHTTADNPVNPTVDISQPPMGGTTLKVFAKPELMIPVRCNNHPWMNAFINVSPNPFYAVSDEDGHFEIKGLPPGTYTLVADHEVLGQQTAQVTVGSKQTATADFNYGTGSAAGTGTGK
jgi:plastocyanin